jgi:hypothetical protein
MTATSNPHGQRGSLRRSPTAATRRIPEFGTTSSDEVNCNGPLPHGQGPEQHRTAQRRRPVWNVSSVNRSTRLDPCLKVGKNEERRAVIAARAEHAAVDVEPATAGAE